MRLTGLIPALPTEPARAYPVIKWAGGKRQLLTQLLRLTPAITGTYFEPFLGGGAMFFATAPHRAVLNDANADLVQMYAAIRDDAAGVMRALDAMLPFVQDEAFYYSVRSRDGSSLSATERAARLIFLNKTCYNGLYRVNRKGQFNVPFGRYAQPPGLYSRDNLLAVAGMLQRADLMCGDFEEALAGAGAGDFVYLDPPYVPLSRTANFTKYTAGSFDEAAQRRLAEVFRDLDRRGCNVLLSNSDHPLVRDLYAGFVLDQVYAARNVNSDPAARGKIAELAVHNYHLPDATVSGAAC